MCATLLPKKERKQTPLPHSGPRFWIPVAFVCLLIGGYDGFFGPGTGSFLILAFHWILRMAEARRLSLRERKSISFWP